MSLLDDDGTPLLLFTALISQYAYDDRLLYHLSIAAIDDHADPIYPSLHHHRKYIFKQMPTITIVREPVSRLLSAWFYRGHSPNLDFFQVRPWFKEIADGKRPKVKFDEYIEMVEYQNIQTRMLGADSFPYRNISITKEVLKRTILFALLSHTELGVCMPICSSNFRCIWSIYHTLLSIHIKWRWYITISSSPRRFMNLP